MDTQIQKYPGGWTKVDGIQPVADNVLIEIVIGNINRGGFPVGFHFTPIYAREVDWTGKVHNPPDFWRRYNPN